MRVADDDAKGVADTVASLERQAAHMHKALKTGEVVVHESSVVRDQKGVTEQLGPSLFVRHPKAPTELYWYMTAISKPVIKDNIIIVRYKTCASGGFSIDNVNVFAVQILSGAVVPESIYHDLARTIDYELECAYADRKRRPPEDLPG
jgi:hypothetical protein